MTKASTSTSTGPIRSQRKNLHQSSTYRDASVTSPSSRVPPTRAKSGCWTCRLRRKKCDENRRADGSCDTCKRLRLECLGWGAKRPEWCRDKSQVERYKSKSKANDAQGLFLSPDGLDIDLDIDGLNPSIIITDASNKSSLNPLMPMNNGGMHDPFNSMSSMGSMNAMTSMGLHGLGGEDAFGFTANASIHHNTPTFGAEAIFGVNGTGNTMANLTGYPFPSGPGELDMQSLETFLAYLPAQYLNQQHPNQHQHQPEIQNPQQLHLGLQPAQGFNVNASPSIWSNHTSPELLEDPFGSGNALVSLYGVGIGVGQTQPVQPITNAVEQSMVGMAPATANGLNNSNNVFSAQNNSTVEGSCLEVNPVSGISVVSGVSGPEQSTSACASSSSSSSSASADGSKGGDLVEGDSLCYSIPAISDSDSATYPTAVSHSHSHSVSTSTSLLHSPLLHPQSSLSSLSLQSSASVHPVTLSTSNANPGLSLPRAIPNLPLLPSTATMSTTTSTNANLGTGATLDTTVGAKNNKAAEAAQNGNGLSVNPSSANAALGVPPRIGPLDIQLVQRQIFYYFNRVRKMQYCFAGETTKDVLRDMVVANPYGVVTNAICALASIHHILVRKSLGQETEDPELPGSLPRRFYEQANAQIMASKSQNGSYTAQDAMAALQFVSFSLFVGGVHGWENALKIAGDWYEKTGVVGHENPLRAMWELNLTAKFASRLVVWFDIFAAITLKRPPRFLATYRKMLRQADDGSGTMTQSFWRKDLNMQATMGCPDAVLLALAEIADLAHWKDQEKKAGSLSNRELNVRADLIEEDLRACREVCELEEARAVLASSAMTSAAMGMGVANAAAYFGSAYANTTTGMSLVGFGNSAPGTPSSTSGESVLSVHQNVSPTCGANVSLPAAMDASSTTTGVTSANVNANANIDPQLIAPIPQDFATSLAAQQQNPVVAPIPTPSRASTTSSTHSTGRSNLNTDPIMPAGLSDADIRRRAGRIFLEGASLYLQTVVSDSNPNVPEIAEGVRATMEAAYLLPPSDVDKSLVFPFTLAGCMAENTEQRAFFKARLSAHRAIGNCSQAVRLMETVWQKRDDALALMNKGLKPPRVHWKDVMDELGMNLLLV